jgi:hypothetical protein
MRFVGILMLFGGYVLVYAAVANSGEFATEPWAGVLADAYTTSQSTGTTASGSPATSATAPSSAPSAASTVPKGYVPANTSLPSVAGPSGIVGLGAGILGAIGGLFK